jgi:hypothetical protein
MPADTHRPGKRLFASLEKASQGEPNGTAFA